MRRLAFRNRNIRDRHLLPHPSSSACHEPSLTAQQRRASCLMPGVKALTDIKDKGSILSPQVSWKPLVTYRVLRQHTQSACLDASEPGMPQHRFHHAVAAHEVVKQRGGGVQCDHDQLKVSN